MKISSIILLAIVFTSLSPIDIKAQESIIDPVVLVPGIMGSWNNEVMFQGAVPGSWNFFPIDHTWDNMISALENVGYERGVNLFIAFYDWRQSNINSATDYLIPTINQALENSPTGKVDIIAHSMGGLVARRYIQSDEYRNDVDQLIMLGTPNYGASDPYTLWEGGFVSDNWGVIYKSGINAYLWYMTTATAQTADNFDTVRSFIPSTGELLPVYEFLVDSENENGLKPYHSLIESRNPFLENLNSGNGWENLQSLGGITVIAGRGEGTVGNIPVVARSDSENKLWADGRPEPLTPVRDNTEGDNRVLLGSVSMQEIVFPIFPTQNFLDKLFAIFWPQAHAQFEEYEFLKEIEIDSKHGDLPTIAIDEIFTALGLANPVGDFSIPPEPDNITSFWFASPVAVKVTDPEGRTITKDSNQIPEAVYTGESDPNGVKMVIIPNALSGQYEIELLGMDNGEYHMGISTFTNTNDSTVTVQKDVVLGEQITYTTIINNETGIVEEVSEPEIILPDEESEEQSPVVLLDELIGDLKNYYDDGKITNKGIYQSLLNDLKFALAILQEAELTRPIGEKYPKLHELKVKLAEKLAVKKLESFISMVEKQTSKNKIESLATEDLINQVQVIISSID